MEAKLWKGVVMVREIGTVIHYFGKLSVAVVYVNETLMVHDLVSFKGATTDFQQEVDSMQLDRKNIDVIGAGKEVAIKVKDRVRAGDKLYKLEQLM